MVEIIAYHGTSKLFAAMLFNDAPSPLENTGITECGKELFSIAMEYYGSLQEISPLFQKHGLLSSGPIGLKNIAEGYSETLFSYGDFYLTTDKCKAVRYATRNPWGSEQVAIIHSAFNGLKEKDESRVTSTLSKYPKLIAMLQLSSEPLLIEFAIQTENIEVYDESGSPFNEEEYLDRKESLNKLYNCTLRIRKCPTKLIKSVWKISPTEKYNTQSDYHDETTFRLETLDNSEIA